MIGGRSLPRLCFSLSWLDSSSTAAPTFKCSMRCTKTTSAVCSCLDLDQDGRNRHVSKRLRGEVASLKDTFARLASQKCRGQIILPLVVLYSRLSRATFGRTLRGAGSISGMKRHESFEHGFKID